jgi:hypothetical protein
VMWTMDVGEPLARWMKQEAMHVCLAATRWQRGGQEDDERERQEWELAIIWGDGQGKGSMSQRVSIKKIDDAVVVDGPMTFSKVEGRRRRLPGFWQLGAIVPFLGEPAILCTKDGPLFSSRGRGAWIEGPRKWSARRSPNALGPQLGDLLEQSSNERA